MTDPNPNALEASDFYPSPPHGWTCFHCGETFHTQAAAKLHFGDSVFDDPGCKIHVNRGLLNAYREAERELSRYRAEDTDLRREIERLAFGNGEALRREEEKGFARGMRDERARALRIAAQIKAGLRNGGARNACDDIAQMIGDPNHD